MKDNKQTKKLEKVDSVFDLDLSPFHLCTEWVDPVKVKELSLLCSTHWSWFLTCGEGFALDGNAETEEEMEQQIREALAIMVTNLSGELERLKDFK
jgi:hypothetical protein